MSKPVASGAVATPPAASPRTPAFQGVVAAMLTPCRAPGEVDPAAMARLAGLLTEHGCDGLFALASTGELPLLDEDDRRALVAAARRGAGPAATIYAGVSGTGVKQSRRYARHAAGDGADAAIIMAPFFLKLSQDELYDYVVQLADHSPIPVGIYHHLRLPTAFEIDTVARLARHPNISVMKDTSADAQRIRQLAPAVAGTGMTLMQGCEHLILPSLEAGAAGAVSALANVAPTWHRDLLDAWAAGDGAAAARHQERIARLADVFRLDGVGRSFAHFAYTLRLAAVELGWIDRTDGMVPGFTPDAAFKRAVTDHLRSAGLI